MGNIQIQNEQQDKSMQIFVNSWNSFNKTMKIEVSWIIRNLCYCDERIGNTIYVEKYSHKQMAKDKLHCLQTISEMLNVDKYVFYNEGDPNEVKLYENKPNCEPQVILRNLLWALVNLLANDLQSTPLANNYYLCKILKNKKYNFLSKLIAVLDKQLTKLKEIDILNATGCANTTDKTKYLLKTAEPCLVALGYILRHHGHRRKVIEAGYLDLAQQIFERGHFSARRAVLWGIDHILRGGSEYMNMIIDNERIWDGIVKIGLNGIYYDCSKEALYCICDAIAYGTTRIKQTIINKRGFEVLLRFVDLDYSKSNEDVISSLCAIDCLLSEHRVPNDDNFDNPWANRFEEIGGLRRLDNIYVSFTASDQLINIVDNIIDKVWNDCIRTNNDIDNVDVVSNVKCWSPIIVNERFEFSMGNGNTSGNFWSF